MKHTAGVLLAGGKSRRMGADKRFLRLDGETLLSRALSVFERLFDEVLIVVAGPLPESVGGRHRVVTDLVPNCASLGGLYTGLSLSESPRVFAAACDMPFLNPDLIAYLIHLSDDDIVMPNPASGLQPMHAVYSKACCPHFKRMIESRNLSIQGILQNEGLRVRLVPDEDLRQHDPELLSFLNVNTPEDAERARTLGQGDTRPGNL